MNIPDEHQTGASENSQQEQREASKPLRHADWISYAVAVTQQAAPVSTDFSSDSRL